MSKKIMERFRLCGTNDSEVPVVAIRWMIHNVVCTNVELANFTNVCTAWRHVVKMEVVDLIDTLPWMLSHHHDRVIVASTVGSASLHDKKVKPVEDMDERSDLLPSVKCIDAPTIDSALPNEITIDRTSVAEINDDVSIGALVDSGSIGLCCSAAALCHSSDSLAALSNVPHLSGMIKNSCERLSSWRGNIECCRNSSPAEQHAFVSLLLPSMVMELARESMEHQCNSDHFVRQDTRNGTTDHVEGVTQKPHYEHGLPVENAKSDSCEKETYCVTWFHPRGIELTAVSIDAFSDHEQRSVDQQHCQSEKRKVTGATNSFTSAIVAAFGGGGGRGGEEGRAAGGNLRKSARMIINSGHDNGYKSGTSGVIQTCAQEWRGHSSSYEVLLPFGYHEGFVKSVISAANLKLRKYAKGATSQHPDMASSHGPGKRSLSPKPREQRQAAKPTFAVRGATIAIPDVLLGHRTDKDGCRSAISNKFVTQLLPRVVLKKKSPTGLGRRQRAVQFLNAKGSRAVRMKTTQFGCGLVSQPITIFLVGIATEDGVFVSGLKRRFCLGHLYPASERDKLTEMSNVCISTDGKAKGGGTRYASSGQSVTDDQRRLRRIAIEGLSISEGEPSKLFSGRHANSVDSDSALRPIAVEYYESSDAAEKSSSDYSRSSSATSTVSQPDESDIFLGSTGPGLWHCYTAIFDGPNSVIRVDGIEENGTFPESLDPKSSRFSSCGTGCLDGLTIGSDHKFDMSLCCGEGMNGEGEGAVAEVAVFKGRLPKDDILVIESHLMTKHGIERGVKGVSRKDDELRRQAHALMVQPPPWTVEGVGVPLGVAAKHPSVAWHRTNNVTGKSLPVPRIGCKVSTGSSDW